MTSTTLRRTNAVLAALVAFGATTTAAAQAQTPIAPAAAADRVEAQLTPEIQRAMVEGEIPSVAIAIVDRQGELWSAAFGHSNLWARTPATTETIYLIGSTFKAQSTVALLQQWEQGKFDLDDPVRDYLDGLTIRGEDPDDPVTFRHMLTHTSGMPADFGSHAVWGETTNLPLDEYLGDSLRVETSPQQAVVYSNMAYSLVAHLVEKFSGVPYKQYIRENLWEPLGMTDTEFDPTPSQDERLSVPYAPNDSGRLEPFRRQKANVWPAGIVYGTIRDQARWMSFNLGDGTADGEAVLSNETIEQMMTLQYEDFAVESMTGGWGYEGRAGYGLTWWTTEKDGERYFAHSGSVSGYTAFVMGNRSRGLGVVLLTNGHRAHPHLVRLSNLALDLMAEEMGHSR